MHADENDAQLIFDVDGTLRDTQPEGQSSRDLEPRQDMVVNRRE
jgi:hypothetical protein